MSKSKRSDQPAWQQFIAEQKLPESYLPDMVDTWLAPLAKKIVKRQQKKNRPLLIGINGSQGSGKSTSAAALKLLFEESGLRVAILSIDDFYLTREERKSLAERIHPLFQSRGVPGTHDVALMSCVINELLAADSNSRVDLPRFDKALDDRVAKAQWDSVEGGVDLVLFEGWCVGLTAQKRVDLGVDTNELERKEDHKRIWRSYVNHELRSHYASIFEQIDTLIMLQAPSFDVVYKWRKRQEKKLAARHKADESNTHIMDKKELKRFIQHYERLTRHALKELPKQADVVFKLDENQQVIKRVDN